MPLATSSSGDEKSEESQLFRCPHHYGSTRLRADIQFVNGSKRQVVFWPKEQKGYMIPAEVKELLTRPLDKGVIYLY